MMSRAERTLVGDWWWTVDRAHARCAGALMVSGLVLLMAGGPPVGRAAGLSTFHFVNRQVLYLAPDRRAPPGGIVPVAAPRTPARSLHLRPSASALVLRWRCNWARDQGRAPLDHVRRLRPPAVRIREAGFRRARRLGLFGGRAAQRHAGAFLGAAAPAAPPSCRSSCSRISARPCSITVVWCGISSSPACTGLQMKKSPHHTTVIQHGLAEIRLQDQRDDRSAGRSMSARKAPGMSRRRAPSAKAQAASTTKAGFTNSEGCRPMPGVSRSSDGRL